ncbi:MAG: hypothetical protein PQJ60_02685 [Spirochaetales bacterium]|nr:hypothetical protein [Spirochaetales bacterium]
MPGLRNGVSDSVKPRHSAPKGTANSVWDGNSWAEEIPGLWNGVSDSVKPRHSALKGTANSVWDGNSLMGVVRFVELRER